MPVWVCRDCGETNLECLKTGFCVRIEAKRCSFCLKLGHVPMDCLEPVKLTKVSERMTTREEFDKYDCHTVTIYWCHLPAGTTKLVEGFGKKRIHRKKNAKARAKLGKFLEVK